MASAAVSPNEWGVYSAMVSPKRVGVAFVPVRLSEVARPLLAFSFSVGHKGWLLSHSVSSEWEINIIYSGQKVDAHYLQMSKMKQGTFDFCFLIGGLFSKTEMSEVLTEILKADPNFDKDSFLKQCEKDIIPNILEVRQQHI